MAQGRADLVRRLEELGTGFGGIPGAGVVAAEGRELADRVAQRGGLRPERHEVALEVAHPGLGAGVPGRLRRDARPLDLLRRSAGEEHGDERAGGRAGETAHGRGPRWLGR